MRRRKFIALFGAAVTPPLWQRFASAQTPRAAGKIGYLHSAGLNPPPGTLCYMRPVWQSLGYVEGDTLLVRAAENDPRRLPELASELIRLDVGVLVVVGPAAIRAAQRASTTVPIVAVDLETDPVRTGLAASFARPGGNITGLFLDQTSLAGKWIELLREASPAIDQIALVWNPNTVADQREAAKAAAHAMGIDTVVTEVRAPREYEAAFRKLRHGPRTGVVQLGAPGMALPPEAFGAATLKYRMPSISFLKQHAQGGALVSYGPNLELYFPRAAVLAHRILEGAKPGDLPIERPDRYEFLINLRTAKALGLNIPQSILLRADEVIE